MACYHPIDCWRVPDASSKSGYRIVFGSPASPPARGAEPCTIPCGKCIGCRLAHSRQWAVRCVHEASLHDRNCFLTLTFDDAHLPLLQLMFLQLILLLKLTYDLHLDQHVLLVNTIVMETYHLHYFFLIGVVLLIS